MKTHSIKKVQQTYVANTYAKQDVVIKQGNGVYAYDFDNKKYIDLTSGIGVNCLGYSNTGWVKAITKQAKTLSHCSNYYTSEPATLLAKQLCKITGMKKVFLANSGAEANECAIKVARKYSQTKYNEQRYGIVTLVNSFHGRTITTLAATGQDSFHKLFTPLTTGFDYAPINDFDATVAKIDKNTCAVMVELVQGEGGVNAINKEYITSLSAYLKSKDILLIIDEVQTGIGRTGTMFAYEQFGLNPDIVTTAKGLGGGLPIGAILFNNSTENVLGIGEHGTTFGSNPIACAGAGYVLSQLNDEFLAEVVKKGEYITKKVLAFKHITATSGLGLMIGISLQAGIEAKKVVAKCAENGLLILMAKDKLRFLPPLNISYQQIDEALDILSETLNQLQ